MAILYGTGRYSHSGRSFFRSHVSVSRSFAFAFACRVLESKIPHDLGYSLNISVCCVAMRIPLVARMR